VDKDAQAPGVAGQRSYYLAAGFGHKPGGIWRGADFSQTIFVFLDRVNLV